MTSAHIYKKVKVKMELSLILLKAIFYQSISDLSGEGSV